MTLGEKIKEARKQCGLTQEEMATKLMVSRQAITKWESDKGIPDIQNIKALAGLLQVSIDYLLDNGETMEHPMMRETIDLTKYKKTPKYSLLCERYPDAEIWPLLATQILTKSEKVIDLALGIWPDGFFGIPQFINSVKNIDNEYFLVRSKDKDYLILITKEYLESRVLPQKVDKNKFVIGEIQFKLLPKPLQNRK